jgi:DNA repair protein RadC
LFREAVRNNPAAVIIAHNHPSGSTDASPDNLACNREIVQAGKLLDCAVIDHLIIGRGGAPNWLSMKERNLGF